MAGGATEVDQATFRQDVDAFLAARQVVAVVLGFDRFDRDALLFFEGIDLDFVVEVADVADDRLILHFEKVGEGDDIDIAGRGDIDIAFSESAFHGVHLKPFHRGLEGVDGVDFGDDDAGAVGAEGVGAAFADIAVAADDGDFTGEHDIGGAFDAIRQGFAAAVEVVEFRFRDRVVDIDGRDEELALFCELVEAVDTGGRFFRDTFPCFCDFGPEAGAFFGDAAQESFDDRNLVVFGGFVSPFVALF